MYVGGARAETEIATAQYSVEESNHSSYFFSILSFKNASLPAKIRILHIVRVVGGSNHNILPPLRSKARHRGFKTCAGGSCSKVFSTVIFNLWEIGIKNIQKRRPSQGFPVDPPNHPSSRRPNWKDHLESTGEWNHFDFHYLISNLHRIFFLSRILNLFELKAKKIFLGGRKEGQFKNSFLRWFDGFLCGAADARSWPPLTTGSCGEEWAPF